MIVARRSFWSMLLVATIALTLTGIITAILGQTIVARQTRAEMERQAVVAKALLLERFAEVEGSGRAIAALAAGSQGRGPIAEARQDIERFIGTARRLLGTEFFDLGVVTESGAVVLVAEGRPDPFGIDIAVAEAGADQFVPARTDAGDRLLVLASPILPAGNADRPSAMVIVARESAVIDFGAVVRGMMLAVAVAALLSAAAARFLSRGLGRGLDGLSAAARSLAAGDPLARAPMTGPPEIQTLAAQFNEMAELLEDARHREREFLMSVGHDLRTPLTTIAGYAEMLDDATDDAESARIAGVLSAETIRLRRLVEDLMLLARLEAREFTLELESVDVGAHLAEMVEGFQPRADAARVRLEPTIEPTGRITTDPDRVAQIAGNLLENALRYTPEAGAVTVRIARVHRGVRIEIGDSGSGIDRDDLPHVFEKFYVAHRYRRVRPEGSGLGLSIVKQLVEALSGSISVVSSTATGTLIRVDLPDLASVD